MPFQTFCNFLKKFLFNQLEQIFLNTLIYLWPPFVLKSLSIVLLCEFLFLSCLPVSFCIFVSWIPTRFKNVPLVLVPGVNLTLSGWVTKLAHSLLLMALSSIFFPNKLSHAPCQHMLLCCPPVLCFKFSPINSECIHICKMWGMFPDPSL